MSKVAKWPYKSSKCPREDSHRAYITEGDGSVWCWGFVDDDEYLSECKTCPKWNQGANFDEWEAECYARGG